jgi:hypothetical protein
MASPFNSPGALSLRVFSESQLSPRAEQHESLSHNPFIEISVPGATFKLT